MNEEQLNQTFKLIDISVSQANAIRISKILIQKDSLIFLVIYF